MTPKQQHALLVLCEFILEPRSRRPKGELAQAYIDCQAAILDLIVAAAQDRQARCPQCGGKLPGGER
jgi:hypothetical protein